MPDKLCAHEVTTHVAVVSIPDVLLEPGDKRTDWSGEYGVMGDDGGDEKKISRGDMMLGVLRCFPIMETPMVGFKGVRMASDSSLCVLIVNFGISFIDLVWLGM